MGTASGTNPAAKSIGFNLAYISAMERFGGGDEYGAAGSKDGKKNAR